MTRWIPVIAITMVALMITPSYVGAETITSFEQDLDFAAIGAADQVTNAYDPTDTSNFDTWDPVPQGVWFGGYPPESKLRMEDVPDDDFSIAYTTVCRFGSELIMSGAARTLVRLPMHTGGDLWTSARLNVYEISHGSNWTFSRREQVAQRPGHDINDMKVNFTAGTHTLIFWSEAYSAADESPTDENDHFTRSNRTYAFVDAPIKPNTFYLFVTYVWYASDDYVDFYIQPDSMDTEGEWNRSDVAVYNELAPDTFTLAVHNLNVSMGYSFDFRNGFGNSAYGLNVWCEPGDEIEFYTYVNLSGVADTDFPTFMLPFRSSIDNVSFNVIIQVIERIALPADWGFTGYLQWNGQTYRDFILISSQTDWGTNKTAFGFIPFSWFKVTLEVNNQTRLWFPLWSEPRPTGPDTRLNDTWRLQWFEGIWESNSEFNYNVGQFIQHESAAGDYNYHWSPQHSLQFNNYYWDKSAPATEGIDPDDPVDDMTLNDKLFYAFGEFVFKIGSTFIPISFPMGTTLRYLGIVTMLAAEFGAFPDFFGYVYDKLVWLGEKIHTFATWLWRAAQAVVGAFEYFVELITIVIGILILLLAFSTLYVPTSLTFKGAMAFRKAILGDIEGAAAHLDAGGKQALGALSSVAGSVGKMRRPIRAKVRRGK